MTKIFATESSIGSFGGAQWTRRWRKAGLIAPDTAKPFCRASTPTSVAKQERRHSDYLGCERRVKGELLDERDLQNSGQSPKL